MKTVTLAATFDGQHIRLQEGYPLPRNARLLVTVLPEGIDDDNTFLDFWRKLSAQSLSGAYSQDEPDYTLSMVREPNPDYEGR